MASSSDFIAAFVHIELGCGYWSSLEWDERMVWVQLLGLMSS